MHSEVATRRACRRCLGTGAITVGPERTRPERSRPLGNEKMSLGSDWSAGFDDEAATSLADAELLEKIGVELRASYRAWMEEPIPERLAVLIRLIEGEDDTAD